MSWRRHQIWREAAVPGRVEVLQVEAPLALNLAGDCRVYDRVPALVSWSILENDEKKLWKNVQARHFMLKRFDLTLNLFSDKTV
jgi:hypothetical protein